MKSAIYKAGYLSILLCTISHIYSWEFTLVNNTHGPLRAASQAKATIQPITSILPLSPTNVWPDRSVRLAQDETKVITVPDKPSITEVVGNSMATYYLSEGVPYAITAVVGQKKHPIYVGPVATASKKFVTENMYASTVFHPEAGKTYTVTLDGSDVVVSEE